MRNSEFTIKKNQRIAAGMYEMILEAPKTPEDMETLRKIRPGQFVNIRIEGLYLRRPISICDWDTDAGKVTIAYKTVGRGTESMRQMQAGQALDILWPLGNGYELPQAGQAPERRASRPLLIGGGAGVPPMVGLCRRMIEAGLQPAVILGFRSEEDIYYQDRFEAMGARTLITTEDGSIGQQGFVTDAMRTLIDRDGACAYDSIYACGPEPMLRAVCETAPDPIPGWFSFEERMGCGFGACMGCSCETKYGSKRICKDGPVLERSEIIW